jgi:hypothetical protein
MENNREIKVHWSFWLIGVFALLWNIGGSANFLMQMTNPEFVSSLPDSHKAIINGRPGWASGGFAIGVFIGAIGCLLMLLKKVLAVYLFIISFVGIVITMVHTVNVGMSSFAFSNGEIFVMIIQPLLVAAILIWYSNLISKKGWLR